MCGCLKNSDTQCNLFWSTGYNCCKQISFECCLPHRTCNNNWKVHFNMFIATFEFAEKNVVSDQYIEVKSASISYFHRRDWRLKVRCDIADICGEKDTNITWTQAEVEDLGDGQYFVGYEAPEEGFLAFYMQVCKIGL